ncbi:hypothetical protein F5Y09DRAFT_330069 [Xylaria sp. FL1042]|nr:hypothetical protein F5Y09DRAFT_330069 [Xylaria sp. FL1042]
MESLRAQLAETQGALTERDKKYRQLRAEQRSWLEEKSALEARIAHLESENMRLQGTQSTVGNESITFLTRKDTGNMSALNDQQSADENETVTLKRSQIKHADQRFAQVTGDIAEKTRLCEVLTAKLGRSSLIPTVELSDDEVVARWNKLREKVRTLSLEFLSQPFLASKVTDKYKEDFKLLSPHWKTYASTPNVTYYLFRALIWRYLLRYFNVPCRAFGRDIGNKIEDILKALKQNISDIELQEWRIRTAALVQKAYPIDVSLINELTTRLLGAISPLVAATATTALETSLHEVVEMAAKLSAEFDRSHYEVLMSNQPTGTDTHGFPFVEDVMDMRARLGNQGLVDLMITPSLLKFYKADYSIIVKAEVIC